MKAVIIFVSLVILMCFIYACEVLNPGVMVEDKGFNSCVKLDNNTYFDITEIDVGSWLSYYTWKLENEGFLAAQKVLPDSTAVSVEVWKLIKSKSKIYRKEYGNYTNQHIGYFKDTTSIHSVILKFGTLDYPITGLTYEQVVEFCKWRTKISGQNVLEYSLPTEEEWKYFAIKALNENELKNGFKDSVFNGLCRHYNFKISKPCSHMIKHGYTQAYLWKIWDFHKDKNVAYNTYGNVSEMTSTKGIAKGGNFMIYANQCHPDSIQRYDKPELWLGFRCIAKRINK